MKKLILTIFVFTTSTKFVNGQINLIPNPSFEDTITCSSFVPSVANWVTASGSPDYFNSIAFPYCWFTGDVPNNYWAYQQAYVGYAYIGICTRGTSAPPNFREWIQTQLNDTLITNKKYCASFYLNLVNNCQKATDDIGAHFSDTAINCCTGPFYEFPSHISNPQGSFIIDTTNWTLVSGVYSAMGGEIFITIGNFKNDANTTLVVNNIGSPNPESYYFVDMVSLIQLPDIDAGINDSINLGDSSQLNGTCIGCWAGLGYQWFPSIGLNDSTIINPLATPGQTTTYYFGLVDTTGTIPCLVDYVDSVTIYVCCVGVNELDNDSKYILYPNPFKNKSTLEFSNPSKQNCTLTLYDLRGQVVQTIKNITADKVEIDRQSLASGLYFFQLRTDRQIIATGKLIVE